MGPMCRTIASGSKGVVSMGMSCGRNCTRRVLHCDGRFTGLPCEGRWRWV